MVGISVLLDMLSQVSWPPNGITCAASSAANSCDPSQSVSGITTSELASKGSSEYLAKRPHRCPRSNVSYMYLSHQIQRPC